MFNLRFTTNELATMYKAAEAYDKRKKITRSPQQMVISMNVAFNNMLYSFADWNPWQFEETEKQDALTALAVVFGTYLSSINQTADNMYSIYLDTLKAQMLREEFAKAEPDKHSLEFLTTERTHAATVMTQAFKVFMFNYPDTTSKEIIDRYLSLVSKT